MTTIENSKQWKRKCRKISHDTFWDDQVFAPIKRMGYSDGPGAIFHGEPHTLRRCSITGEETETRLAHFVVKNAAGESEFFRVKEPMTLAEFKAMCAVVIPGVGPCSLGYGKDL